MFPPFFELLANPRQEESTQIGQQLQSKDIETLVAWASNIKFRALSTITSNFITSPRNYNQNTFHCILKKINKINIC